MFYKLPKPNREFKYHPFPQCTGVVIYHFRLGETQAKEMREQCGKQFFNKATGQQDFEVTDPQKFDNLLRDAVLSRWEGFHYDDDDDVSKILAPDGKTMIPPPIPQGEKELFYKRLCQWMKMDLVKRALGIDPAADEENLLDRALMEEKEKNS